MADDLTRTFEWEMAVLKFKGNKVAARKWMDWQEANQPRLIDHARRLLRALRKGRLPPPKERGDWR